MTVIVADCQVEHQMTIAVMRKGEPMSDLISRQEVIDAVVRESQVDGAYGYMDTKSLVDLLHDMPSALQEQKTGKWVTASNTQWYACSECAGAPLWDEYDQEVLSDYCPHCGAKMGEER